MGSQARLLGIGLFAVLVITAINVEAQNASIWVLCLNSKTGPCGDPANWTLNGPTTINGTQTNAKYSVLPGTYTLTWHSGGPPGNWTVTVYPAQVTVAAGQEEAFTIYYQEACISVSTPVVTVPTTPQHASSYNVTWNQASSSDSRWEIEEWTGGVLQSAQTVSTPSATFTHSVANPTTYVYRVRAKTMCGQYSAYAEKAVEVLPAGYVPPPARNPSFNFDANADLLWWNSSTGMLFTHFMNGTATSGGATIITEPNTAWRVVGSGDTDLDGDTEILLQNDTTRMPFMYRVNGATFVDGGQTFVRRGDSGDGGMSNPWSTGRALALADFGGDGRADILWRTSVGAIDVMEMNGTTVSSRSQIWREPSANWKIAAVGDTNGDGKADLLFRNTVSGLGFMVLTGGANGVWHNEPDANWQIVAASDVSGDGKADVVWRNTDGRVWIQLMDGLSAIGSAVVWNEPDAAWQLNGLADVNGDGRHDMIWRHTNGTVFVVLLDGLSVIGSGVAHIEPDANWTIVGPGRIPQNQ